ncbi:hypothetical protein [Burkholderia lata]|uniref:hypothetical protein n=1 Tax=Burkholderia lata (strain ATCC 17760 / DSM 23089 / LMG 22485 / NCIMB 9086 / R18194 / 383) TaxID=482957 RepID=UPI00158418D1|nr:hypothetical protein [Burkholderia lata]
MEGSFNERVSMKEHRRRVPAPEERADGSLIVIRRITIDEIGYRIRRIVECFANRTKRLHRFAVRCGCLPSRAQNCFLFNETYIGICSFRYEE